MIGIYFSGTGNSKYALEVFMREYDNDSVLFSIEDKNLLEQINYHDEIVFSYPVQYIVRYLKSCVILYIKILQCGKEKEFLLLLQWHCLVEMVQEYWVVC